MVFSEKQKRVLGWWTRGSAERGRDALICDGAVRSGKTLCLGLSFVLWSMARFRGQQFALCGKTRESIRRNLLPGVLPLLGELGFRWEEKVSKGELRIWCGRRKNTYYLFGGKDEGSAALIQGITLAGVLLDEVALMPRSFVEQACARCSVAGAKLWFSCNPAGPGQLRGSERHPFALIDGYVPLHEPAFGLYRAIREAVPVVDAAVLKLVRLAGGVHVSCADKGLEKRLAEFLRTVPVGWNQVGLQAFLDSYLDCLLTCGKAVGEVVPTRDGRGVAAVLCGNVSDVQIQEGEDPLSCKLARKEADGSMTVLPRQELLLFTPYHPDAEHPYGVSLLHSLPFLSGVLLKIWQTLGANWERAGNVRFAVVYKPGSEGLDPRQVQSRAGQLAKGWSEAMSATRGGSVRDFVAVGDVEIKVIGAECEIPDCQAPVRLILEQLIAQTGIPPFLLGLNWSSTERMSSQQADIMTSELTALRRTLTPVVEKICRLWMRLQGLDAAFQVEWEPINLQDQVEMAKAELYRQQAAQLARRADEGENEPKKEDGDGDSTQAGPGKA